MDKFDSELRNKAENILKQKGVKNDDLLKADIEMLVEELNIYKFELDHQNEALRNRQIELENSKEDYEDLFNSAPVGYVIVDENFELVKFNNYIKEFWKINSSHSKITEFIYPEDQDKYYLYHKKAFTEDATSELVLRVKSFDSTICTVRLLSKRRYCHIHKAYHLQVAFVDITETIKLQEVLVYEKERAEKSDKLKSAFLANMSHEIRTPMNSILGFSSLLAEGAIDAETRKEYANLIMGSGKQLMKIINDILDISKIEAKQLNVNPSKVKPYKIMHRIYRQFLLSNLLLEKEDVKLVLEVGEADKDIVLLTDELRLSQVIQNLISNAIKFTDKGVIRFGFYLEESKIHFYVKDTGCGISDLDKSAIFETFVQSSDNKMSGGTGLGLSISRSLVKLLGGDDILLESEKGKGSCFCFNLSYDKSLRVSLEKELEVPRPDLNNVNLIIAEDDDTNYLYLNKLVSDLGAKARWAKDGRELIHMITNDKPDVILLDINMPVVNGLEVLLYLKNHNVDTKVIVQTAYAMSDEKAKFIHHGADAYISKPIKKDELYKLIANVLNK